MGPLFPRQWDGDENEATQVLVVVSCRKGGCSHPSVHLLPGSGYSSRGWSEATTSSVSSCGRKKGAARNSTSSISEDNLFSLFPQTYIFTDEEDGALKRRMGNDLSYDTTFLLHLQPLNCPGLEKGSGVRVGCPAPALPTETCALPCPVVVMMIWCSWLTPGHAADWR